MYSTIIFDLDDTLTNDFENTKQAFKRVLEYRNEEFSEEKFLRFNKIDKKNWNDLANGKLIPPYKYCKTKKTEWLRANRFINYFGKNNISYDEAVEINKVYMNGMKEKVIPRKGAKDLVKYLYNKSYKIIIATNGPIIPLKTKIEKLSINHYIDLIFSAEEIGVTKPYKGFYDELIKRAEINSKSDILFVGDDLEKDIKGGINNGIDTCWCNYNNIINDKYKSKYEIHELEELKQIL